jgi:hypothetical protein
MRQRGKSLRQKRGGVRRKMGEHIAKFSLKEGLYPKKNHMRCDLLHVLNLTWKELTADLIRPRSKTMTKIWVALSI